MHPDDAPTPDLTWLDSAGSTQDELLARLDREGHRHGAAVATADQRAGRGRHSRVWSAAPGAALALSVYLRPESGGVPVSPAHLSWLSLVASATVAERLAAHVDAALRRSPHTATEALALFRFVHDKDVFAACFQRGLAQRLLERTSASAAAEHAVLAQLRHECGPDYTADLDAMLRDMHASDELSAAFAREHPPCALDVRVLDTVGLATPIAARMPRIPGGRIGHDKSLGLEWQAAQTGSDVEYLPPWFDKEQVRTARAALQTEDFKELRDSYSAPLTWERFVDNLKFSLTKGRTLTFDSDPAHYVG